MSEYRSYKCQNFLRHFKDVRLEKLFKARSVCHSLSSFLFFNYIYLFIYLSMAVLGLRFCARAFSSCGERGPLFIAVRGPLTIAASLVAEHRLQTRRLSNCGSRAQLLRGMWGPPRPALEPVSPALAGRLSTTAPPGKPHLLSYTQCLVQCQAYRDTKHRDERATKQTGGLEELGFSPIF